MDAMRDEAMSLQQISAHFSVIEFAQPAKPEWGAEHAHVVPYPGLWLADRLVPLCALLEQVRIACGGHPIRIISGFRTVEYNREMYLRAGKKPTDSQHSYGRAADIAVEGVAPGDVHRITLELAKSKSITLGGLAEYNGFVHVDIREQKPPGHIARWVGSRTIEQTV